MNSPSSRTSNSYTSCSLCILLLLLLAIRDTSSFYSIPKIIHSRCISADVKSEKRSQILQRITYVQNNFQRGTTNSLEATTTTYLDSLNDITSNPHLFPTTSDYIKTLSSQSSEGDTIIFDAAPSAEEFLTQLSTELLKASENNNELIFGVPQHTNEPTTTATVSSASAASASAASASAVADAENTINRIAEFIGPAFSSALGVSVAASTYNPAYYSHLMASTNIDYTKGAAAADGIAFAATNVMGNEGLGTVERVVSDAASSTLMQDITDAVASSGDKVAQRIAESTAPIETATGNNMASSTTTATSIANSIDDATNNLGDKVTGAIENIASKASISVANAAGGGITTEDAVESVSSWHKSQGGSPNSLRDLASSIPTPDTNIDGQQVLDFISRNGIDAGGDTATGLSDVSNIVANAYASSSEVFAAQASSGTEGGGGGSILSQLASSIPTDIEELNQVREQMNQVSEQATTTAASTTMQDITSAVVSSGDNSVGLDTASAVTSIDTVGLDTMSAASDSTNEAVSNTLSSQLSDLSYDGLTNSESAFPSTSVKAPMLSDLINDKVQHVEMPKMTNPFSDGVPPSMDNAFSSIKEASGASKDMLESAFGSMSHTIDGLHLGDKVPDLSNSFEGLSDQLASGTNAIGIAVQRSERGWSAIGSKVTEQARKSNINHLQAPEMNIPKPNIKMPKIDIYPPAANLNFEAPAELIPQPNFPNIEIHPPPLPNLHVSEGASSALYQVSDRVGDTSLSTFGNAIVSAITFLGGIIVKFLDLILGAVTGGGTSSVASLLSSVHDSITSTIDSASHAVTSTLMNIGNMSIIEIIEHLLALVIAISDILLKIMNAVIYLISGKDGTEWALMATSSINEASSQLLAQASSTYDDVTHTSLSQIANTVGDYSNYVGNEFITVMGSLNHINGGGSLLDGISLPDETLDGVATAVQTALSL